MFVENSTLKTPTEDHEEIQKSCRDSSGISMPHENDVLMGRGGKNNQHSGNEILREFARGRSEAYRSAAKKGKSDISRELVRKVRQLTPPGRFLRKNAETCKWEDVGDDIAREKTSQVLRDAVSEKNGPMARSKQKTKKSYPAYESPEERSPNMEDDGVLTSVKQEPLDDSTKPPPQRELRPPDHQVYPFHHYPFSGMIGETSFIQPTPQQRPSVTPAATTMSRKRPRYYESPMPSYSYHSPYYSPGFATNTPPGTTSSPAPWQHLARPSQAYSSPSSHYSSSPSPASAMIPSHYTSQTGVTNQPWVADVPPYSAHPPPVPPTTASHDFDLFNGELLSDHSDHRDGAISPFTATKRDSL